MANNTAAGRRRPAFPARALQAIVLAASLAPTAPALARQQPHLHARIEAPTFGKLVDVQTPKGVLAYDLSTRVAETLATSQTATLVALTLAPGVTVDLELERFWIWGPATQFFIATDQGDIAIPPPPVVLFRGVVQGFPESKVFLSASPSGFSAIVRFADSQYILAPSGPLDELQQRRIHQVFDSLSPDAATFPVPFRCDPAEVPGHTPPFASGVPGWSPRGASRVALVAIDADFEFRARFANPGAAALYICELLGAVSVFYETDVNLKLALSFVRVWDTAADPYSATGTGDQLTQFKNFWEANMGAVPRNTAHLLSARPLGGGIAYLDQMCGGSNAYGVNADMSGSFPRPPQSGNAANWDLYVVAHELGHSFSSPHSHCYSPPVDRCYTSEGGCATGSRGCQTGTIMSYCHTCTGGVANIDLTFGPVVASHIQSNLIACVGPARNPCFVNAAFTGTQQGTSTNPMRSIARGSWYVTPFGTVSIAAGNYSETMTISQPMTLTASGGLVAIGR